MGLDNPLHIAFLLILVLLVFGAKRLPEMGRSLGAGMRGFKETLSGEQAPSSLVAAPDASPVAHESHLATPATAAVVAGDPSASVAEHAAKAA
jgi:sec-independent protein translocase protein TatA